MDIKKTKNYVIGIGLVILIILGVLNACSSKQVGHAQEVRYGAERFQSVYFQYIDNYLLGADCYVEIIIDTQTGTKYLFVKEGYGAGLTKLDE